MRRSKPADRPRIKPKKKPLRGTLVPKHPMPWILVCVAYWPDHAATMDEARESSGLGYSTKRGSPFDQDAILKHVWLGILDRVRPQRMIGPGNVTKARYRLSALGVACRAFIWWVAARRMMGWPFPCMSPGSTNHFGATGRMAMENLPRWVRGDESISGLSTPISGYWPGDAADCGWPDLGFWDAL